MERGEPAQPAKVTLTSRGGLDPGSRFFTAGEGVKLVYTASRAASGLRSALAGRASVVDLGPAVALPELLADLARRGVRRLMVEGGGRVHTQFLTAGLVDELHLVVAPLFVGAADAPRFVHPGAFPHGGDHRMELAEVRRIGDVVLLVYRLGGGTGG
ncbi:RibD domain-containing protein [Allonocardiopsis opalescens]|uniref:RibD domain-containing protein n=1 Tax=Allonocardiopsis opalescens TaxID=1144618 RepID=A0A2T0Q0K5_9ACTN|nr:RibD domain-containing protein [Allonocardiopsis opalescens]